MPTREGMRNFLAVGGDGTSYEIVNGLFPEAPTEGRPALGFLPLGTGNSFLRDFTTRGVEHTIEALQERQAPRLRCDSPSSRGRRIYFMNLLSLGFPADVGETDQPAIQEAGASSATFSACSRASHGSSIWHFRIAWMAPENGIGAPAFSSRSATANLRAAK